MSSRLRLLERKRGGTHDECAVCGLVPGARLPAGTKFAIEVPRAVEVLTHDPVQPQPEDFCAGCGRQVVFRLGLDRLG